MFALALGHPRRPMQSAALLVLAATLLAAPATADAAQRYAAPAGAGSSCTQTQPCSLAEALSGAQEHDEVILAGNQGSYGTPGSPLGALETKSNAFFIDVHGAAGQPRPVIYADSLSTYCTTTGHCTNVSDLDIEKTAGSGPALYAYGNLDHVIARSRVGSDGCQATSGTGSQPQQIDNSICVSDGGGTALTMSEGYGGAQTAGLVLRNDTFVATGSSSDGIALSANSSSGSVLLEVLATNVIARGGAEDVSVESLDLGGAMTIEATLSHSNFASTHTAGTGTAKIVEGAGDQRTPPKFANAAEDDFHEAAGSPTIDAGITEAADGSTDLDGDPRTIGPATDIGAYEAAEPPTLSANASAFGRTTALIGASVNPGFAATSVQAFVGPSVSAEVPSVVQNVAAGLSPVSLSFPLGGLRPGTVYHFHVVATNSMGSVSTPDQTFTTLPAPTRLNPGPTLTAVRQSAERWREGGKLARISAKRHKRRRPPVGTTFSFSLNEAATVTLRFSRHSSGRKVGKRCLAPSRRHRRGKRCRRTAAAGSISFVAHAGEDRVFFDGRLSASKRLAPGRYTVAILASNAGGSSSARLSFTIVR